MILRTYITALTLAAALVSGGCTTALKQAYYGMRGAGGSFYEVRVVDPEVLASYESLDVQPFTNDLGPRVPDEVMRAVNRDVPRVLSESSLFSPGGKLLSVKGRVVHYTGASGLTGAIVSVIGSAEECVCRVELRDAETGDVVGEAVCWGSVKSAFRRGAEEFGVGVGKGILAWLERRLPEHVREARRSK
jgi:hypothetical protein